MKGLASPAILHVVKDEHLLHYMVCYAYENGRFVIGDPASGVSSYTPEEVDEIWQSKSLLLLEVGEGFAYKKQVRKDQWRWIRRLVENDLNILTLALVLGVFIALLGLSTALFSQMLIDRILPEKRVAELAVGLVLLTILLWSRSILSYVRGRFLLTQSRDFNNRVIGRFFGSLVHLPQPFFYTRKTGDLIARMNDTHRLQGAVTHILGNVMIDALVLIVSAVFVFIYSVPLGLLCMLSLPLIGILAWIYHRPIVKGQQGVMAAHAINESNYVDAIQGMEAIKTGNKENVFANLTKTIYGFFQDRIFALGRIGIRFNIWAECISVALSVAVLAYSAVLVLDNRLQIGQLVAVLQMSGMLIPAAISLALTNLRLQEARVAFERMYEFASLQPEYEQEPEAVIDFCKRRGFDRFFSAFPQGYITLLGEEGINISGGQRQLVALARAMYQQPQLLLLDEATAAMDRETERLILTMLRDMRKEIGVVLVTHRAQVARYADRIYILENGRVTSSGKPEELAVGGNLFARSLMDFTLMSHNAE